MTREEEPTNKTDMKEGRERFNQSKPRPEIPKSLVSPPPPRVSQPKKELTAEETEVYIKNRLAVRGFAKVTITNNRGLIGAVIDEMNSLCQPRPELSDEEIENKAYEMVSSLVDTRFDEIEAMVVEAIKFGIDHSPKPESEGEDHCECGKCVDSDTGAIMDDGGCWVCSECRCNFMDEQAKPQSEGADLNSEQLRDIWGNANAKTLPAFKEWVKDYLSKQKKG